MLVCDFSFLSFRSILFVIISLSNFFDSSSVIPSWLVALVFFNLRLFLSNSSQAKGSKVRYFVASITESLLLEKQPWSYFVILDLTGDRAFVVPGSLKNLFRTSDSFAGPEWECF